MTDMLPWDFYASTIEQSRLVCGLGRIRRITGLLIESVGPEVSLGEICFIHDKSNHRIMAEVVGFNEESVILMPYGPVLGISPGAKVTSTGKRLQVRVGASLPGRVIDPLGNPIDGGGDIITAEFAEVEAEPPNPISRPRIDRALPVGVRAIDSCITCGNGQRVGVFAGSGVGKSTLMGMIARNTEADINVIALVGERGREVREFIERDLGEDGLQRSVVVVATSSEPAIVRLKGAFVGTAIAEYFRDQGMNVMLMMDSVTRFALAQREIGLSIGEPPTTRGYPPSVFSLLPRLFERAGTNERGSITAIYTVLVEGGDMDEPVADAVRGLLDGHIILSRELAQKGHFPAIDILQSSSRLLLEVSTPEHIKAQMKMRELLAVYDETRDLIDVGAYQKGSNPRVDEALAKMEQINSFLKQGLDERFSFAETMRRLSTVV
jgi:flagellum-specific ATP synthase